MNCTGAVIAGIDGVEGGVKGHGDIVGQESGVDVGANGGGGCVGCFVMNGDGLGRGVVVIHDSGVRAWAEGAGINEVESDLIVTPAGGRNRGEVERVILAGGIKEILGGDASA